MKHTRPVLLAPFLIGLLAVAFCVWSAFGNDVDLCISAGCSLYQDFSVGGLSLWWIGSAAFSLLACLALLGFRAAGRFCASLFLLCDIGLLLLLALTAPCISCLIAAIFFVALFLAFRSSETGQIRREKAYSQSHALAWIWLLLFTVNVGTVVRSQFGIWPILGEGEASATKMFFSPSCSYCREGINRLSGNVDVAFYPLAENHADISRIEKMQEMLDQGMNIAEAVGAVQTVEYEENWKFMLSPRGLLLRFRLLRNKSHVLSAGTQAVPFFEHRGLPAFLMKTDKTAAHIPLVSPKSPNAAPTYSDPRLPAELISPECSDSGTCP